jgi:hypothetical protein
LTITQTDSERISFGLTPVEPIRLDVEEVFALQFVILNATSGIYAGSPNLGVQNPGRHVWEVNVRVAFQLSKVLVRFAGVAAGCHLKRFRRELPCIVETPLRQGHRATGTKQRDVPAPAIPGVFL